MTVSMRLMSAGDGYKYLLRTVAAGDGDRDLSTPLTRYYNADGTPPGRWMGAASLRSEVVTLMWGTRFLKPSCNSSSARVVTPSRVNPWGGRTRGTSRRRSGSPSASTHSRRV